MLCTLKATNDIYLSLCLIFYILVEEVMVSIYVCVKISVCPGPFAQA